MSNEITVTIKEQGGRLLWADFTKAIQESIGALNEVAGTLADSKLLCGKWRILNLSMNSPVQAVLTYEPVNSTEELYVPSDWIDTFVDGMGELEAQQQQPRGFSAQALRHVEKLLDLRERIGTIEYKVADKTVVTSVKAAANAAAVRSVIKQAKPRHYYAYGELRGALEAIDVHGSVRQFSIWDRLTGRQIRCEFSDDPLQVAELITKRIAVTGRIAYDRNDNPVSVAVDEWHPLKAQNELASLDEIRRAMAPLPEGQDSEDYVRGLRDDD